MRKVTHHAGNALLILFFGVAFGVGPKLAFAQLDDRAKIKAFEQTKLILKQHKASLLEIPGVDNIKISREATGFAFKVFISETASQDRIPQDLQGIPVKVIIQKMGLPATLMAAYERAKAVRDRYKLSKLGHVQIVGQPGGQFILVVAVDSPRAQEEVPKVLDGIPVRSYVRATEPEMADPAYRRVREIQTQYTDSIFEYEGVVELGVTRKELVTSGTKEEQDGNPYVLYLGVREKEDLLYVPQEIEGVRVVSRVTGIIRAN